MELFLEFVFTISFSLFFSFFLAKLLSIATTHTCAHDVTKRKTSHYQKFQEISKDPNWETETKLGFGSKFFELGESIDDQVFTQQELLNNQRLKIFRTEVEKTEEQSRDEAQKTETDMSLIKEEVEMGEKEEIGIKKSDINCEIDSDDWEGIERSETERLFGAAVAYVGSIGKITSLARDLKLQLYGLYQVAMEGPCFLPQPMPLKVSARAKWNAWQQLGNMSREAAMEHYISLLSTNIPEWMEDKFEENGKQDFAYASMSIHSDFKPSLGVVVERSLEEQMPHDEGIDMSNIKFQRSLEL